MGRLSAYDLPVEDTARGSFVVVDNYLEHLKELGVYEDATIIITADHGDFNEPSVIFFVKGPEEEHEEMQVNDAPISHCELLPTLADYVGLDYTNYGSGSTVWDITAEDERERYFLSRAYSSEYPTIDIYNGTRKSTSNIFRKFIYHSGDLTVDLSQPDAIIPMVDSFN
jgi:arylsulfatase A-like enzyme